MSSSSSPNHVLFEIPKYAAMFWELVGWKMIALTLMALLAAILESLGIMMLLPVLESMNSESNGSTSFPVRIMRSWNDILGISNVLVGALSLAVPLFCLKSIILFLNEIFRNYTKISLGQRLKIDLYNKFTNMTMRYYYLKGPGFFVNLIGGQLNKCCGAFYLFIIAVSSAITAIIFLLMAILFSPYFGLTALFIGLTFILSLQRLALRVRELSRKRVGQVGLVNKMLIQSLESLKYLAATGQSMKLQKQAAEAVDSVAVMDRRIALAGAAVSKVREPILVISISIILYFRSSVYGDSLPDLFVSILLFYRSMNSLMSVQSHWQSFLGGVGAVEFVVNEVKSNPSNNMLPGEIKHFERDIEFRNVSFAYEEDNYVLRDVNLVIPKGKTVAIVSKSGGGKTTLVDLLTLLIKPTQGEILIDGKPADRFGGQKWQGKIGYVSQEVCLFNDSIANNICMWSGDTTKDADLLARIKKVSEIVRLHEFISSLDQGYETLVGDKGVRLSGGQRQRLFLARELFREPDLLILDEATSALDGVTEKEVLEQLNLLAGTLTIVLITHRLTTLENADRIILLKDGSIAACGSYAQLKACDSGLFRALAARDNSRMD